ncbi:uncharacterized protein [Miscanthus floridulus]|uniref:uncharacterized protein isoform X2 n=1 Tax=Miscanthus floridulus TaxID=154761 RepID=UPI00345ABC99
MQHPCGALPSGRRRRGRYLPHPPRCCYLGTRCARGGDGAAGPAATAWPVSYGRGSWPPPSRARQYANLFREQAFASRSIPVHFHQLIHDARMRRASLLTLLGICASARCGGPACSRCSESVPPPSATACSGPKDWYNKLSMLFWFWTLMILPALLLQELFYLFWQVIVSGSV